MTMKKIVIINSSPRKNGNCDLLCTEFGRAAVMNGENEVVRIDLMEKDYDYYGEELPEDDMASVAHALMDSNVIVLATPLYFYNMSGQLKVFMDRLLPYFLDIQDKDFYFFLTAATPKAAMESAVDSLYGFTDSLPGANVKGVVYGYSVSGKGDILSHPAMREVLKIASEL